MVGRRPEYTGVPTNAELENNSNQTKYIVNEPPKGSLVIPKWLCALFVLGAILLAVLAAVAVYFLAPWATCLIEGSTPAAAYTEDIKRPLINMRLSNSIEPISYEVFITPFFEKKNFTTHGNVTIKMRVNRATDRIQLNVEDLKVYHKTVRIRLVNEDKFLHAVDQGLDNIRTVYTIYLDRKVKQNSELEVALQFSGHLNENLQGFYRSSYVDNNKQTKWLASTLFSPTDARKAFPCFDEPSFKATFTINIQRASNMSTLSNMPLAASTESSEILGWYWDHYPPTPRMSSYLVAFIVSDLAPFQYKKDTTPFTVWSRRETLSQGVYAANIGSKILSYFEEYFGIPYPLKKIDAVAVPDFGVGGMENWGLVMFREFSLLFDEQTSTIDDKQKIARFLGHEMTHQWFGNLVTPKWWDDLWLKEGFSKYFMFFAIDHVEPSWNFHSEFPIHTTIKAFELDALKSSRPLSLDVTSNEDIRQAFDAISLEKGASVIRMLRHVIGERTFQLGLRKYLDTYKYKNANHEELWSCLTTQAHQDVVLPTNTTISTMMKSWTTKAGYPVITAVADYNLGRVNVTQKRFLYSLDESNDAKADWWVPISNTTQANPDFRNTDPHFWLRGEESGSFVLNTNGWWLLNINQTGYYIINYDEENWKRLSRKFMDLPPIIRTQLIIDSMNLARANLLDYGIPLKLISTIGHLDRDITYVPLYVGFHNLEFLYDILANTPAFGNFDRFVQSTFRYAYDKVGFNETSWDNYLTQMIRIKVLEWACKSPDSKCVNEARHYFRNLMNNNINVSPNVRLIAYCAAIREGGEAEWNFALRRYETTNLLSEKNILLKALGCSSKRWVLAKYLSMIITNNTTIRKQDGDVAFIAVAKNIIGNQLAFEFLRNNWNDIANYFGGTFERVGAMIKSLAPLLNSRQQLEQLKQFKDEVKNNLGANGGAFDQCIEIVKHNVEWMRRSYKSVEIWLETSELY